MAKGKQQPLPGLELSFDHPIDLCFVRGSGQVSDLDAHRLLEELDNHITPDFVEATAKEFASEKDVEVGTVIAEDDARIATPVPGLQWKELFEKIGHSDEQIKEHDELTYSYQLDVEWCVMPAHREQAIALGRDPDEAAWFLVAQKDD